MLIGFEPRGGAPLANRNSRRHCLSKLAGGKELGTHLRLRYRISLLGYPWLVSSDDSREKLGGGFKTSVRNVAGGDDPEVGPRSAYGAAAGGFPDDERNGVCGLEFVSQS